MIYHAIKDPWMCNFHLIVLRKHLHGPSLNWPWTHLTSASWSRSCCPGSSFLGGASNHKALRKAEGTCFPGRKSHEIISSLLALQHQSKLHFKWWMSCLPCRWPPRLSSLIGHIGWTVPVGPCQIQEPQGLGNPQKQSHRARWRRI